MNFLDTGTLGQIQNLAYLLVLASVWTILLAVIMPGTGAFEVVAGGCLFLATIAVFTLPVNLWALLLILAGLIAFGLELRRPMGGLFLVISILLFTAGSVFLFRGNQGELAGVTWWLAAIGSMTTAFFFWLAFSRYINGKREAKDYGPDRVVGMVGEARTEIYRGGSVQVASALWSARSDERIPVGSRIRVISRDGLTLTVTKEK
jgi:membrane-bound serine protease (ClpP class)